MSKVIGQMRTCDRCGYSQLFKYTRGTEIEVGSLKQNAFEVAEGWDCLGVWDLCPKCAEEWRNTQKRFMEDFMEGRGRRETETVY